MGPPEHWQTKLLKHTLKPYLTLMTNVNEFQFKRIPVSIRISDQCLRKKKTFALSVKNNKNKNNSSSEKWVWPTTSLKIHQPQTQ